MLAKTGRHEDGARLLGWIDGYAASVGIVPERVATMTKQTATDALESALGHEQFAELCSQGAAMTWADAVAYAQRGRGPRAGRPLTGWESLTPTERQVAELVATGASNKEVAARLFMSVATVKSHLTHAYAKLGVESRTQLAASLRQTTGQSG